jgi:SpoVK/Ycf46/Vps4 family AAA+-type ATPase
MLSGEDALRMLREALQVSPDNLPLRQHLAETLLGLGRAEEAEQEYRLALRLAPEDQRVMIGLASAFYQQGKNSEALVVVESLLRQKEVAPRAYLLHARLLYRAGTIGRAVQAYHRAVEFDPSIADPEFAERLGIRPGSRPADDAGGDFVVEGKVRAAWEGAPVREGATVERPAVRFQDVGGMEAVKDEIRLKIIHPLSHPELYRAYGKPIGGGILLYGPPGCGKTHLARATSGEIDAGFLAVGLNDVLEMWIGSSERNLHDLFEQARRNAPCVLFFDEVDALGASRTDMRQSAGRQLINQFLAELDGVQASNDGVLILAATNAPWHLDSAFRRPGRFDRILFVPPPDAPARAAILRILCRGKPVDEIDYDHLARKTDRFSGADLKAVVDVAVERKLQEALKAGVPKPLTTRDLTVAAGTIRPSTKEWFATARNYALYANQGGLYDDILAYLNLR